LMPPLPVSADPASVRIAIRGQDVALLEVEVSRGYATDPLREETLRLRSDVETCRDAVQALDDEDVAEQARLGFAGHLSEAAATAMARAVSFGRAGQDDLAQMAGHLADSTASALARRREIGSRRRTAKRELQAAEQRLADAESRAGESRYVEVAAAIEAAGPTRAEVELSYHVEGAYWQPLYDLALTDDALTASYLAEVTQQTGEDWPGVRLVLSTSRHGEHHELPELRPWYIGRRQPAAPRPPMHAARLTAAMPEGSSEVSVPLAAG